MKKKLLVMLAVLLCLAACVFSLTSCNGGSGSGGPGGSKNPDGSHSHSFGEWKTLIPATCEAGGKQERVCSCGEKESKDIAPAGHSETTLPYVAPTCAKTGLSEGKQCSVCKKILTAQIPLPTTDHNFKSGECTVCHEKTPYVFTGDFLFGNMGLYDDNNYYNDFDGVYPAMISVTAPNEHLEGKSLVEVIKESTDREFDLRYLELLLDTVDENGYAPLSINTVNWLTFLFGLEDHEPLYDSEEFAFIIGYYDIDRHTHRPVGSPTPLSCADGDRGHECAVCHQSFVEKAPDHSFANGKCSVCQGSAANVWDGSVAESFGGGDGSESNPFIVSNGAELAYLAALANSGKGITLSDKYVKLTSDIDLDGREWDPIGSYQWGPYNPNFNSYAFWGHFDGDGHVISNFKITEPAQYYYNHFGLFGAIWKNSSVKNLGVTDFNIDVSASYHNSLYVGGLAGTNWGTVSNCYTGGSVKAYNNRESSSDDTYCYVGGLVGSSASGSSIEGSYSTADVRSECNFSARAGGLAGSITGTASNCYASGNVSVNSNISRFFPPYEPESISGGLAASVEGTVTDCYALGSVTDFSEGRFNSYAGGLIGSFRGTLTRCYATGSVATEHYGNSVAGGLIGRALYTSTSMILGCHASGNVSANTNFSSSDSSRAGGLVGQSEVPIESSYATGDVFAAGYNYGSQAGGLVGDILLSSASLKNCYATGVVTSINDCAGGLVGRVCNDITIENCYCAGLVFDGESGGGMIGSNVANYDEEVKLINCFIATNVNADRYLGEAVGDAGYYITTTNTYVYEGQILVKYPDIIEETDDEPLPTCTADQLGSASFYTDTLTWDSTVWDLSSLDAKNGVYPTLLPVEE